MPVALRPMTPEEVGTWLPEVMEGYVRERVDAGEDEATARSTANAQSAQLAPRGVAAEGQHFFWLLDEEVVGALWLGRTLQNAPDTWYVYFVVVHDEFRRRGYGRAAMMAAEQWSRQHDGRFLGLNVFGHNHVARALYDSLGYVTLTTQMRKELA